MLPPLSGEVVDELFGDLGAELVMPQGRSQAEVARLLPDTDLVVADWSSVLRVDDPGPRVRFVQVPAVGTDSVDLDACAARRVPVANCAGANASSVAEWCVGAVLTILRQTVQADRAVRAGDWPVMAGGQELTGQRVGVVGLGAIGREVSRLFVAFGCQVRYWSRSAKVDAAISYADLDDLLATSDVVVVVIALGAQTRNLIDATRLKPGAVLVNAARGEVLDESSVAAATGLRGAALDVFSTEPLPADSPLRDAPHVLLSPHAAGSTQQASARILAQSTANLRRVLAGEDPVDVVNGVHR